LFYNEIILLFVLAIHGIIQKQEIKRIEYTHVKTSGEKQILKNHPEVTAKPAALFAVA